VNCFSKPSRSASFIPGGTPPAALCYADGLALVGISVLARSKSLNIWLADEAKGFVFASGYVSAAGVCPVCALQLSNIC